MSASTAKQMPGRDWLLIDTLARPDSSDLKELTQECDLFILPTIPDVASLEPMMQTAQELKGVKYFALITMASASSNKDGNLIQAETSSGHLSGKNPFYLGFFEFFYNANTPDTSGNVTVRLIAYVSAGLDYFIQVSLLPDLNKMMPEGRDPYYRVIPTTKNCPEYCNDKRRGKAFL